MPSSEHKNIVAFLRIGLKLLEDERIFYYGFHFVC